MLTTKTNFAAEALNNVPLDNYVFMSDEQFTCLKSMIAEVEEYHKDRYYWHSFYRWDFAVYDNNFKKWCVVFKGEIGQVSAYHLGLTLGAYMFKKLTKPESWS